MKGVAYWLHY